MVSLLVAATRPMDRTTRLAKNRPPPSKQLKPKNTAIVMNINDLDDDDSPDADDSAMVSLRGQQVVPPYKSGRQIARYSGGVGEVCSKCSCSLVQAGRQFQGIRTFKEGAGPPGRLDRDLTAQNDAGA